MKNYLNAKRLALKKDENQKMKKIFIILFMLLVNTSSKALPSDRKLQTSFAGIMAKDKDGVTFKEKEDMLSKIFLSAETFMKTSVKKFNIPTQEDRIRISKFLNAAFFSGIAAPNINQLQKVIHELKADLNVRKDTQEDVSYVVELDQYLQSVRVEFGKMDEIVRKEVQEMEKKKSIHEFLENFLTENKGYAEMIQAINTLPRTDSEGGDKKNIQNSAIKIEQKASAPTNKQLGQEIKMILDMTLKAEKNSSDYIAKEVENPGLLRSVRSNIRGMLQRG
ncbi:hypothetical protein P618_200124 [Holospora obtusa F1]|uniref:Uncharacterized protein n=1 Tax=Holospora obtusa F1 TaxID=1399147 RepID=W6TEI2_HOLOB|nr:hypothetical protein [Holospora obtusa]ETZ07678.1 hypothetical protein P618_200124 [Holospora obtusa F1]